MAGWPRGGRSGGGNCSRPGGSRRARRRPSANLTFGSHGPAVKALQQRLNVLHYYVGKVDGAVRLDDDGGGLGVQGGPVRQAHPAEPRHRRPAMQGQLGEPEAAPGASSRTAAAWRVEVNKNLEVLVVYKHGKITLISHVSTAAYSQARRHRLGHPERRLPCAWQYLAGAVPDSTFGGYHVQPGVLHRPQLRDPRHAQPDVHLRL